MMRFVPSDYTVSILGFIDSVPKYEIEKIRFGDELPGAFIFVSYALEGYKVNTDIDAQISFTPATIADFAARGARARAQFENQDMVLFPEMPLEEAGFARQFLEKDFGEDYSLAAIDSMFFGAIASLLWQKKKVESLPLIKQIVPMSAPGIVKLVEPIFCSAY
jgi:hypothetical protein